MSAAFDMSRVVATACASDPSLLPEVAEELAAEAWVQVTAGVRDAPELSRRLMDARDSISPSQTNAVATAVVAFCESEGLLP